MLTTGIIKQINLSSGPHKNNIYLVELSLFQTPGDYKTSNYTYEANCSVPSGMYSCYNVGDKVYVDFLNDKLSHPIIIGKIYQGNTDEAKSYAYFDTLKVKSTAEFSKDTKIGDFTYDQISKLVESNYHLEDGKIVVGGANGLPVSSDLKLTDLLPKLTMDDVGKIPIVNENGEWELVYPETIFHQ